VQKVFEGLKILLKYEPKGDCCAEHDEFYAGQFPPEKMEEADVKKLDDLGWHWDESLPSWRKFV
jgi:hypothetical protein